MKAVPQTRIDEILRPIFETRVKEARMEKRLPSVDPVLEQLKTFYLTKAGAAFVDNLENPKSALVVVAQKNLFGEEYVVVALLWVDEEMRDTKESRVLTADMLRTLYGYAEINGIPSIQVSAWCYQDSQPQIDSLWESQGFDLQERVYTKHL